MCMFVVKRLATKGFVNHVTSVSASMNTFMFLESAGASKCFITYITTVWCVSMNAFVSLEMAGPTKCFATYITMVWSFTSVNAFVCLEMAGLSKCFVTRITIPSLNTLGSFVFELCSGH